MGSINLAAVNTISSNPLHTASADNCAAGIQDSSSVAQGASSSQAMGEASSGKNSSEEDSRGQVALPYESAVKERNRGELRELAVTLGVLEKTLAEVVSQLNEQERSDFLLAVVKTGDRVGKFIETTRHLSGRQRKGFLSLAEKLPEEGVRNFLTAVNNASRDLDRMIDTASKLLGKELGDYLSAAAMAGEGLTMLIKEVDSRLDQSEAPGGKELSGFLSAAARSAQNVMTLISTIQDVSRKTGGKILAHINALDSGVELAEFISMMDGAGEKAICARMERPRGLTGEDREILFGIVSRTDADPGILLSRVENMGMDERSGFFKMAAAAPETMGDLLKVLRTVSRAEQKEFLGVGRELGGNTLKNFIRTGGTAAANAPVGTLSNLVGLTRELKGRDREYLLAASVTAEPGLLGDLMNITVALGENLREKQEENPGDDRIALARHSFLTVASDAGHNLGGLIRMTETLVEIDDGAFIEILDSAVKTGKYLGGFIQAYV
ncbi:MAG: hypothetical protein GY737_12010 [Desulfobacteraceae bacterium]|nr:hypothetical protein [Desulfobacteraceae bacterium]